MKRFLFPTMVLLASLGFHASAQSPTCTSQEVRTEISIQAPPEKVWATLMDIDDYPQWHAYLHDIEGKMQIGKTLKFTLKPGLDGAKQFKAKLQELSPSKSWAWGGSLPLVFTASHYFLLSPQPDGSTHLVQGERWSGLMGKSYGRKVYKTVCERFSDMNAALKTRCETK